MNRRRRLGAAAACLLALPCLLVPRVATAQSGLSLTINMPDGVNDRVAASRDYATETIGDPVIGTREYAQLRSEAFFAGALGGDGTTIDLRGNCQAWPDPVNCVSLVRVENRFGDGDGLYTGAEQERAAGADCAWTGVAPTPSTSVVPARRARRPSPMTASCGPRARGSRLASRRRWKHRPGRGVNRARGSLLVDLAFLHHERHGLEHPDVLQRIAGHGDEVASETLAGAARIPDLDAFDAVAPAHALDRRVGEVSGPGRLGCLLRGA